MLRGKRDQAGGLAGEEWIRGDIKRARALSHYRRDTGIEFAFVADTENFDLLSEAGSRRLQLRHLFAGAHTVPIDQHSDEVGRRYDLAQQLQALRVQLARDIKYAGSIASRPVQALDQA